jgi:hypothetical protein
MADFAKTMLFSHHLGPFFNSPAFTFNGIPAAFADLVMMVGFSTEAIDSLTIITSEHINNLVIDQTLQRSIDSGQTNAFTFSLHESVYLLGASETACALKCD